MKAPLCKCISCGEILIDTNPQVLLLEQYMILVEDRERTFNINMHSFDCLATSEDEAIGKMYKARPEFRNREILSINKL